MPDAKTALEAYIKQDQIADFSVLPYENRINALVPVVRDNIEQRSIGKLKDKEGNWHDNMVPYIPHTFAKKAIAFLFNNRWGCEIVERSYDVIQEPYQEYDPAQKRKVWAKNKDGTFRKRNIYQSTAMVRFTFQYPGEERTWSRDVVGTGRAYDNPAMSTHEVEKMAVSNCYTLFLQSFGIIPRDIAIKDYDAVDAPAESESDAVEGEVVAPQPGPPTDSNFGF